MSRFKIRGVAASHRVRACEEFSRLLSRMESTDEYRLLTFDVLSVSEVVMLMRRIEVARRLRAGETYETIVHEMRVSKTLVKDTSYRLSRGGKGFVIVEGRLENVRKEMDDEIRRAWEALEPGSWERLMQGMWMMHWPELIGREMPRIGRDLLAAYRRKNEALKK